MNKFIRGPYRGHDVEYMFYIFIALYALTVLWIAVLSFSVVKLTDDIKSLNEQIDILNQRIDELESTVNAPIVEEPEEDRPEYHKEAQWPKLYTEEDAIVLTKMLWGEARGIGVYETNGKCVSSKCQQAAVIWTVLNRYDAGYAETITKVVTAKNQFVGYRESNPIDEELMTLVLDVLDRWNNEKHGETKVGRVLPSDYMWFRGDGRYNHFRNEYTTSSKWNWILEDVYQ